MLNLKNDTIRDALERAEEIERDETGQGGIYLGGGALLIIVVIVLLLALS